MKERALRIERELKEVEGIISCMECDLEMAGVGECTRFVPDSFYKELNDYNDKQEKLVNELIKIFDEEPEALSEEGRALAADIKKDIEMWSEWDEIVGRYEV